MQAVESETLILYHTDLRGEWPRDAARALAARLRYGKRLAASADSPGARASLAGIALALRALSALPGRAGGPGEIGLARGAKRQLAHDDALRTADDAGTALAVPPGGAVGNGPHPRLVVHLPRDACGRGGALGRGAGAGAVPGAVLLAPAPAVLRQVPGRTALARTHG